MICHCYIIVYNMKLGLESCKGRLPDNTSVDEWAWKRLVVGDEVETIRFCFQSRVQRLASLAGDIFTHL